MQIKMTPIIPQPLNVSGIQQALVIGMRDTGERIREEFEDTVKTWNHKVNWEPHFVIPKVSADYITVTTETEDKIYGWTDEGTKRHEIPTVPGVKRLAFPGEFIAKTSPGVIGSGVGFSGGAMQFPVSVSHPGTKARKFAKTIAKNNKNNFKIFMQQAMVQAAKASKHRL